MRPRFDSFRAYPRAEAGPRLSTVAAIVTVGDELAERTRAALPSRLADRVHVVRNGIDTERFRPRPEAPAREPGGEAPLRVMYVVRVIPEKGPDVLIRAAGLLPPGAVES